MKKIILMILAILILFIVGLTIYLYLGGKLVVAPAPLEISREEVIEYLNNNITSVVNSSAIFPQVWKEGPQESGKWFVTGFGFVSENTSYVDFENGLNMYRALTICEKSESKINCLVSAFFEKNKNGWTVVSGNDSYKNESIIYKWAQDYEWER